jgi:hypothetical protein
MLATVDELLDTIPFGLLQAGELEEGVSPDIFMETLVNNIRNETISHQIFIKKSTLKSIEKIVNSLKTLKNDYTVNQEKIFELESALNTINDRILKKKLESCSNFEILNNEKITPHFVNLAKGFQSEASLEDIVDNNGNRFPTPEARKEFIRNYYQDLYAAPLDEAESLEGCIESFLGPELLQSNLIKDSIIPPELREELEQPFSEGELDESAQQGNRSASGMDGLSNCFIKKYWNYLRTPLFKYASYCLEQKKLSHSFKTASIKLIPKKGDTSKI